MLTGRCGTKLSVTARPQHFCPGARPRAPSMCADGQPMTQRPSTMACVESLPSLASISSETAPPDAGPWAKARAPAGRSIAIARAPRMERMAMIKPRVNAISGPEVARHSEKLVVTGTSPPTSPTSSDHHHALQDDERRAPGAARRARHVLPQDQGELRIRSGPLRARPSLRRAPHAHGRGGAQGHGGGHRGRLQDRRVYAHDARLPRRRRRLPQEVRRQGHGGVRHDHEHARRRARLRRRRRVHHHARAHPRGRRVVRPAQHRRRPRLPDADGALQRVQARRPAAKGLPGRRRRRDVGQGRLRGSPDAAPQPDVGRGPRQRRRVPRLGRRLGGPSRAALPARHDRCRKLGPNHGQRRQGHHQRRQGRPAQALNLT
mmetsp:Transcript_19674/g.67788  ORF Transcript_19674/g.67788 Transcript_19674/m.67788 type:complete len:376 (+) Transcript_19674:1001-2128(+)